MNSAGHRKNILNSHFTDIGIGLAKGIYQNRETIFIVQMFGQPAKISVSAPVVPPAPPAPPKQTALEETQSFVAVKNVDIEIALNPSVSVVENLIASPRTRTEYLYFIILAVVLLALILNVFVKVKIQHPHLIMNAAILIIIINSVLIINQYLININGKIF